MENRIKEIESQLRQAGIVIGQLHQSIQKLQGEQETGRKWLEKLALAAGLEWSQDVNDWVLKTKLDELRKSPR